MLWCENICWVVRKLLNESAGSGSTEAWEGRGFACKAFIWEMERPQEDWIWDRREGVRGTRGEDEEERREMGLEVVRVGINAETVLPALSLSVRSHPSSIMRRIVEW